ncbi:hypothetical protein CEUSTIGMA_g12622.t1 [Chlamydomonas eustigma]|uniref:CBM20 domain-containing protein n=1 Tax=Chlamydomonas eustigma TaxID=1157962 RepID=A0A250XQI7_9CHLO|nr:hypothetical protein CEUSTIGMA_g12622.t1 [Chlamydomonas eustigma]|eukprot:GAX85202.1 hypothetical protein CEUSTIGMA_g12622.t1 [Chlamydomonas eustigma]
MSGIACKRPLKSVDACRYQKSLKVEIGRVLVPSFVCSLAKPKQHPYHVRTSKATAVDVQRIHGQSEPGSSSGRYNFTSLQRNDTSAFPGTPRSALIRFVVPEFVTAPGQVLAIVGSGPALGNWDANRALRMAWMEGHKWVGTVQLDAGWHGALEFKLAIIDGACAAWEPGSNRLLVVSEDDGSGPDRPMEVTCCWGACAGRPPVPARVQVQQPGDDMAQCMLVVPQPAVLLPGLDLGPEDRLVLTGGAPILGDWDPDHGIELIRQPVGSVDGLCVISTHSALGNCGVSDPVVAEETTVAEAEKEMMWMAALRLPLNQLVEAKLVVLRKGRVLEWEAGPNRSLFLNPPPGAYIRPADTEAASSSPSTQGTGKHTQPADHSRYDEDTKIMVASLDFTQYESDRLMAQSCSRLTCQGTTSTSRVGVQGAPLSVPEPVQKHPGNYKGRIQKTVVSPPTAYVSDHATHMPSSEAVSALGHVNAMDRQGLPVGRRNAGGREVGGQSGGRGYKRVDANDADLARLLGVDYSDDEDSEYDEDGRPRSSLLPASVASPQASLGLDMMPSPLGLRKGPSDSDGDMHSATHGMFSNIVTFRNGSLAGEDQGMLLNSDRTLESQVEAETQVHSLHHEFPLRRDTTGFVARPTSSSSVATSTENELGALAPLPPTLPVTSKRASGGDFVVMLHWGGAAAYTQAIYRPLVTPQPEGPKELDSVPITDPHNSVYITVPYLATQPGQYIVITGSTPELGSWDAKKGLHLCWGPGHRWTGKIQVPLKAPIDMKVLICSDNGDAPIWEPGMDRHIDLERLVVSSFTEKARSRTDVLLTCVWGQTGTTLALCVQQGHESWGDSSGTEDEGVSGMRSVPQSAVCEGIIHEEEAVCSTPSTSDQDLVPTLTHLLAELTVGSLAMLENSALSDAQHEQQQQVLLSSLQDLLSTRQQEMEGLKGKLVVTRAALEGVEGRMKLQEAAAVAAQAEVITVRAAAAKAVSMAQAEVQGAQNRVIAEVAASRAEYEARILDVQRQYEARILDLQQHEARILSVQQQHDASMQTMRAQHVQQVSGLEAQYKTTIEEALISTRQLEHLIKDLQQRMSNAAWQHEVDIQHLQRQHHDELAEQAKLGVEKAGLAHEQYTTHVAMLMARKQEEDAKAQMAMQKLVEGHALELNRVALEHDSLLTQVVLRLASVEKEAETMSSAMRQQHSRKVAQMEALVSEQERRGIALAQAIGSKQVELDDMRGQLVDAERARQSLVRERDQVWTRKEELEEEVKRLRKQLRQVGSHNGHGSIMMPIGQQVASSSRWSPWRGWGAGLTSSSSMREDHTLT